MNRDNYSKNRDNFHPRKREVNGNTFHAVAEAPRVKKFHQLPKAEQDEWNKWLRGEITLTGMNIPAIQEQLQPQL